MSERFYPPNCDGYPFPQGWQCPVCSVVYSPTVRACACSVDYGSAEDDDDDEETSD